MKDQRNNSSTSCVNICTFFTFVVIVTTFGTFSILQWKEIVRLNEKVTLLELKRSSITVQKRHQTRRDTVSVLNNDVVGCCNNLARPIIPITPSGTNIAVNKGTDITIPCHPTGLPPPDVHWSPSIDPRLLGRYIQTADGLLIRGTDITDTGNFTCQVSNVFGTVEKTYQLTVTDPIQISVSPPTSKLNANQNIDLVCTYNGVPKPSINWYHINYKNVREPVTSGITNGNQQSVLHLSNVGALSAGSYVCEANNGYEKKETSSAISVISTPEIINGPKNQMVSVGTTVTLKCDVVSNPPASVAWTFPQTGTIPPKTATIHPDGSVTLFHVDSFNEGDYTCTASNAIGTTTSKGRLVIDVPFTVTASPHKKELTGGETYLQLTCATSTGGQVTWSKENSPPLASNPGKYLTVGNGLIITSVDLTTDTGVYVCSGSNGMKQATDKVELYKGLGQLTCNTTFMDCGVGNGGACGGTCPNGCRNGAIYGYLRYTMASSVCMAAEHAGGMNSQNRVIWTVNQATGVFSSQLSHGILSQSSGPELKEAVFLKSISTQPAAALG